MKYAIVCDVKGKNPGTEAKKGTKDQGSNESCVIVQLVNTESSYRREEVGRVAFVRANSSNKRVAFKTQLRKVVTNAQAAIEVINELDAKLAELKSKAGELT